MLSTLRVRVCSVELWFGVYNCKAFTAKHCLIQVTLLAQRLQLLCKMRESHGFLAKCLTQIYKATSCRLLSVHLRILQISRNLVEIHSFLAGLSLFLAKKVEVCAYVQAQSTFVTHHCTHQSSYCIYIVYLPSYCSSL